MDFIRILNINNVTNQNKAIARNEFYLASAGMAYRPEYAWADTAKNRANGWEESMAYNGQNKPLKNIKWVRIGKEVIPDLSLEQLKQSVQVINSQFLKDDKPIDDSGFGKVSDYLDAFKSLDNADRKLRIVGKIISEKSK